MGTAAVNTFGEEDAGFLRRAAVQYKWTLAVGMLLLVLGPAYAIWGVAQADPERTPHPRATFDAPIARLANLTSAGTAPLPVPRNEREEALVAAVNQHRDMSGRVLVLLLRVLISSMTVGLGLVAVAIAVTQKRFLLVIARMQPGTDPGSA